MKKTLMRTLAVMLATAVLLSMGVTLSADTGSENICYHTFPYTGSICTGTVVWQDSTYGLGRDYSANAGTYHPYYDVAAEIYVEPYLTVGSQVTVPNNVHAFSRTVENWMFDTSTFIDQYDVECSHNIYASK